MSNNVIPWMKRVRELTFRRLVYDNLRLNYHGVCDWFLFSLFILPSYFGIRLAFFDLTAVRFFEVLLLIMIWKHNERREAFFNLIRKCPHTLLIFIYMFIITYTNLIHPSLGTIFYWLMNGVFVFYFVTYLIIQEYGTTVFLRKLRLYTYFLTILSPLELILHKSPFAILDTLNKSQSVARFGNVRIFGNCGTPNGYGLYLGILLPIICYDPEKKNVNLLNNRWLIMLVILNGFLTGSRLAIGIMGLCILVCFILQKREGIIKSSLFLLIFIPACIAILFLLKNTSFTRSLLCTFFSAFDEVFNTNYALLFGADENVLYNSSYYRKLLFQNTFFGGWLNPLIGRGGNYNFRMYIEGYDIQSTDNFYVGQYITYAYPGLIAWLAMSASFLLRAIKYWFHNKNEIFGVASVSIICYFISLWYLDQLQTFPFMFAIFGMVYAASILQKQSSIY